MVGINHDEPIVYADTCTDSWDWYDADSIDISCPGGHGWTWRTGRELVTADGSFTTLTVVFGPDLDAPFTPCPHCAAHAARQRSEPCGGTITGEHGVGVLKKDWLAREIGPVALGLHRSVKRALDPLGILNPGKVFSARRS